jgi:hypothetical protein
MSSAASPARSINPETSPAARTRYPGSRPFTRKDEPLFFGRTQDIENLATFINVEKLVVLYGKSGLGKSSLLNAGVLPKLIRENSYVVIPVRFGGCNEDMRRHPLDIVEDALAAVSRPNAFLAGIQKDNIGSWQYIKQMELASRDRATFFLVFDQFEELFTYPNGIDEFAETLADLLYGRIPKSFQRALRLATRSNPDLITSEQLQALERPINLRVLMSIRSDRMSLLDRLSRHIPSVLQNCYELKPLSRVQAESAIVKPAGEQGDFRSRRFSYEAAALTKILNYLTQEGRKPIESFQLQILCQFVEESIVVKNGDDFVEAKDLGDLESVYEEYYGRCIEQIADEAERRHAQVFIEEGLIFAREERRIPLYEGQIESAFQIKEELLGKLVDTHLIRAEPHSSGGYMYELSHDTLVAPILRAKARRLVEEQMEKDRLLALQKKAKRKKKIIRAVLFFIPALLTVSFSLFIMYGTNSSEPSSLDVVLGLVALISLPFLFIMLGIWLISPLAFAFEFVTGDSVLARLRRRTEDPAKQNGILTRIGRWLS